MVVFCGNCVPPGCGKKIKVKNPEEEGFLERCCPSFWNDTGVPPVPVLNWIFSPTNKYLNDNPPLRKFGNIGLKYFDYERKLFMLCAAFFTVMAMFVTTVSAASNTKDPNVVMYTNWGTGWYRNETSLLAYKFYIGLHKIVVLRCEDARGSDTWASKWYHSCEIDNAATWDSVGAEFAEAYDTNGWDYLEKCKEQAVGNQFGSIMTCTTLIFALMGCLTRARKVADTNFQKVIGCVPDSIGLFTLGITMMTFYAGCYSSFPKKINGMPLTIWIGPGLLGLVVCWFVTATRVIVHYMTPTPGNGVECSVCCIHDDESVWGSAKVVPCDLTENPQKYPTEESQQPQE